MLQKLFQWYIDNQSELVKKYDGKVLVIKDDSVVGVFNTDEEAYFDAIKKYEKGTYIIQKCSVGTNDYSQIFHSRVVFA